MNKDSQKQKLDYKKLGFKAGLEVHQQLNTKKLFCDCDSRLIEKDKPDYVFSRKFNLSASEFGIIDEAALQEFEKEKDFEYHYFDSVNCLVEADEEPPHSVNKEALTVAIQISLMVNAGIFSEVIGMRKIVIDGSNVSGFQRTTLISEGGTIQLKGKKIGVQAVVLEEDSARKIEGNDDKTIYNLDRLGIPLIEFTTNPELETPEEVKECALKMGEFLRRTGKCNRGLGSIRQDLNISIKDGARTELKGVQEVDLIETFVDREITRQIRLNELKKELEKRKIGSGNFEDSLTFDLADVFLKTRSSMVKKSLDKKENVFAFKLPLFKGLLGFEVQPDRRFATELADVVKVKTGLKGLLHSDELPNYGIEASEIKKVREVLECKENDAFILILGNEEKAVLAIKSIKERCLTALKGTPNETRQALENGNSKYLRPMAGSARMYLETDLKPVRLSEKLISEIKKEIPLSVEERVKLYSSKGLSSKLAEQMKLNNYAVFFESLLKKGFNATTVAVFLLDSLKEIERNGYDTLVLTEDKIEELLLAEKEGLVLKENLKTLTIKTIAFPNKNVQELISLVQQKTGAEDVEKVIDSVISKNKDFIEKQGHRAVNALMGQAMKELKGKASAKELAKMIEKKIS